MRCLRGRLHKHHAISVFKKAFCNTVNQLILIFMAQGAPKADYSRGVSQIQDAKNLKANEESIATKFECLQGYVASSQLRNRNISMSFSDWQNYSSAGETTQLFR